MNPWLLQLAVAGLLQHGLEGVAEVGAEVDGLVIGKHVFLAGGQGLLIFGDVILEVHWQAKLVHGILNVQRNRSFRKWLVALPFYQRTVSFCFTN